MLACPPQRDPWTGPPSERVSIPTKHALHTKNSVCAQLELCPSKHFRKVISPAISRIFVFRTKGEAEDYQEDAVQRKEITGITTSNIERSIQVFTGRRTVFWEKNFARFLRLACQIKSSHMIKAIIGLNG